MGLVLSSYLDTLGFAKANDNTGFTEDFVLLSRSSSLKVTLLHGGDTIHVAKKTGRGIPELGEFSKWASIRRQNDQSFTNCNYEAEPVIGPGKINIQQHNGHDDEADGTPEFRDGGHNLHEEGSGQIKIKNWAQFYRDNVTSRPSHCRRALRRAGTSRSATTTGPTWASRGSGTN